MFKAGANSVAQLVSNAVGIPSGPVAEEGDNSLIASIIMESVITMSVKYWFSSRAGEGS